MIDELGGCLTSMEDVSSLFSAWWPVQVKIRL